jgi:hypothetical protein
MKRYRLGDLAPIIGLYLVAALFLAGAGADEWMVKTALTMAVGAATGWCLRSNMDD